MTLSSASPAAQSEPHVAHPVDRHVGLRIRVRRKEIGLTQEQLAEALGITFQQVQKYERAANRVSASKLWEIARALRTSVSYFYDGASDEDESTGPSNTQLFLLTPEGQELAAHFPKIGGPGRRRKLLELVRVLAETDACPA